MNNTPVQTRNLHVVLFPLVRDRLHGFGTQPDSSIDDAFICHVRLYSPNDLSTFVEWNAVLAFSGLSAPSEFPVT